MKLNEWIAIAKARSSGHGSESQCYIERSDRILISLVSKLVDSKIDCRSKITLDPELVAAEDIMVYFNEDGDACCHFVKSGNGSVSCLDRLTMKCKAMEAIGRMAYHLLMRETTHLTLPHQLLETTKKGNKVHFSNSTKDEEESKSGNESPDEKQNELIAAMIDAGVPLLFCQAVSDLLRGERSEVPLFQTFKDTLVEFITNTQVCPPPEIIEELHLMTKEQV